MRTTNYNSVVYRAPEDVWRLIFLDAYASYVEDSSSESWMASARLCTRLVSTLYMTCRLWRDIVCEMSVLWTRIAFIQPVGVVSLNALEWFEASLMRSGTHMIEVGISIAGSDPRSSQVDVSTVNRSTSPHLRRIGRLVIDADRDLPRSSRLIKLSPRESDPLLLAAGIRDVSLPVLRELELKGIVFESADGAALFLDNCPELRSMRITSGPERMVIQPEHIMPDVCLPKLERASIEVGFLCDITESCVFDTPLLRELIVTNVNDSVWQESRLFHTFTPSLHSLTLTGNFDQHSAGSVIDSTPGLRNLSMCGFDHAILMLFSLTRQFVPGEFRAPDLEVVTLLAVPSLHNDNAILFLNNRCVEAGAPKTVLLHVICCPYTTESLGEELVKRERGSWVPGPEKIDLRFGTTG